jgi:glutaredoxin
MNLRVWPLAAALLLAALPAPAQYRWVDSAGRVNYGDQPPGNARNLTRIEARGGASDDPNAGLPYELRRAASQHPITLYTADGCAPCEAARVYLRRRGVPFSEITVAPGDEAAELKRRFGATSVPVMTVGRTPRIDFDEAAWSSTLDAAAYPKQSILPVTFRQPVPQSLLPRVPEPAPLPPGAAPEPAPR